MKQWLESVAKRPFISRKFGETPSMSFEILWITCGNTDARIEIWMLLLRAFHPIVTIESIETAFCPSCPFFLFMTCLLGFAIWNLLWVFFIHFYCYCMTASILSFLIVFSLETVKFIYSEKAKKFCEISTFTLPRNELLCQLLGGLNFILFTR